MCRHLAYLGPQVSLDELLLTPEYSLLVQSYAPREQIYGTVNADGFGVGWYDGDRPEPLRYRRAMPMWTDSSFAEAATALRSACVVAAVRDATVGFPADESCAQPFRSDDWLFSHNGAVADDEAVLDRLGWPLPAGVIDARAPVDSAALFAYLVRRRRAGDGLATALGTVVRDARAVSAGRYNLLAADGGTLAATAAGDTLYIRTGADSVQIASEPYDDRDDWKRVPDGSLVRATRSEVSITPLE